MHLNPVLVLTITPYSCCCPHHHPLPLASISDVRVGGGHSLCFFVVHALTHLSVQCFYSSDTWLALPGRFQKLLPRECFGLTHFREEGRVFSVFLSNIMSMKKFSFICVLWLSNVTIKVVFKWFCWEDDEDKEEIEDEEEVG